MTSAIAALAVSFLLVGAAAAQEPGTGAVNPSTVPGKPDARPSPPKIRDQLLQGAINVLLKPRPTAKPAETAPAQAEAAATIAAPVPTEIPAEVAAEPIPAAPQPGPSAMPLDPVKPVPAGRPPAAEPTAPVISPAEPAPRVDPALRPEPADAAIAVEAQAPVAPEPVSRESAQAPILAPQPTEPVPSSSLWWLTALVAVAAAVLIALRLQRTRRISKTRALLSLHPSLDPTDGACTVSGLSLAAPPMSIRVRLDLDEPEHG